MPGGREETMCQKCVDAAKRHYPQLNDREIGILLFEATCFPFGSPEQVEEQLVSLKAKTDGSLGAALQLADEETDMAMRDFRSRNVASLALHALGLHQEFEADDAGWFDDSKRLRRRLTVQVSDGGGWDHASVSLPTRTPTWAELEYVRRAFFVDDETVMQLHVPASDHVNRHEFCLHLWRPQSNEEIAVIRERWEADGERWPYGDIESPGEIPRPDSVMV